MAGERNLTVDMDGFEKEMAQQQAQSGKKDTANHNVLDIPESVKTVFKGYETLSTKSLLIWKKVEGDYLWIVTSESPFYVESGGQVNDQGTVTINGQTYEVIDLKKVGEVHGSFAIALKLKMPTNLTALSAPIFEGDEVMSTVNEQIRLNIIRNHTATHMLQAALVQVLGAHVKQAGSVVTPDYLRFDFAHHEAMSKEQIQAVELLVNQKIQEDIALEISSMSLADAQKKGIIAFFGEKYNADCVRVVSIPKVSAELCGGTHASRTGIIGSCKITSEVALATGVRRIVAITGQAALTEFQQCFKTVKALSEQFKVKPEAVVEAVLKAGEQAAALLSEIKQLKKELLKLQLPQFVAQFDQTTKIPFLFLELSEISMDDLRALGAELERAKPGIYCLVSKQGQNPVRYTLFLQVAKVHQAVYDLKKVAPVLAQECGIRGGGSSVLFQGTVTDLDVAKLQMTLKKLF